MFRVLQASPPLRASWFAALASAALLAGCSGNFSMGDLLPGTTPSAPSQPSGSIGEGQVKVGLILPLSGTGNAAVAAQSMRNAAEMALAEFNSPEAVDEGAEIILGPLFALTVGPVGQVARARGIPVIAFSTDANVAARGVYLLSFLPESDVERIVGYAASQGKRSFAALIPDHAYGSRWRAAADASSRSSAIRSTAHRCRGRCAMSHRRRVERMPSSFPMEPRPCPRWCRR